MNHSPFWPLVWKEYRASRAFWLAMAVIGLGAQASAFALAARPADRDWWLYGLALMISTGFALGIGSTLFAVEHEDRTFGLLRVLPLRPGELGFAKLLSALVGVASLVAVLWLTASVMAGGKTLSAHDAWQLWGLWGLACAEGLGWGILCSLAIRSPLRATLLAVVAVSLANQFGVALTQTHNLAMIASYVEAVPFRLALLALVVVADVWLLPRWLAGQYPHVRAAKAAAPSAGKLGSVAAAPTSSRVVWHLVWQSWREGRGNIALLLLALPIYVVLLAMLSAYGLARDDSQLLGEWVLSCLPPALLGGLVGALVFHADQIHGPRFLAARGVSARSIWLSRQIAWGGWLVVWAVVLILLPLVLPRIDTPELRAMYSDWWWEYHPVRRWLATSWYNPQTLGAWQLWRVTLLAYAAGQFVSLWVRKGVVALVLATVLGIVAATWALIMSNAGVPAWWSVLPVGLALLLATWLRTPGWLIERSGWRAWIAPVVAVAAPVALLAFAVPHYRANEFNVPRTGIPNLERVAAEALNQTYSVEEIAEAQKTLELYARARMLDLESPRESVNQDTDGRIVNDPDEPWLQEIVNVMLEAANRPYNLGALPYQSRLIWPQVNDFLAKLLLVDAKALAAAGRLDQALDIHMALLRRDVQLEVCQDIAWNPEMMPERPAVDLLSALCEWAGAEGQTPQGIRAAIERLEAWHAGLPPVEGRLLLTYQEIRNSIEGKNDNVYSQEAALMRRFASERERALHLLDAIAGEQINLAKTCQQEMEQRNEVARLVSYGVLDRESWWKEWLETTPLVQQRIAKFSLPWYTVSRETSYRATLIGLAVEAWKLEQGKAPESLAEVSVPGFDRLPLDPVWGYPFLYYPDGIAAIPQPVISSIPTDDPQRTWPRLSGSNVSHGWLYADFMNGKPFIWSAMNQQGYRLVVGVKYGNDSSDSGFVYSTGGPANDLRFDGQFGPSRALDVLAGGTAYEIP